MIKFTQDRRAMREGYASVYINPASISAIVPNPSRFDEDNKSTIILNNGEKITVQGYPDTIHSAIADAYKDTEYLRWILDHPNRFAEIVNNEIVWGPDKEDNDRKWRAAIDTEIKRVKNDYKNA